MTLEATLEAGCQRLACDSLYLPILKWRF